MFINIIGRIRGEKRRGKVRTEVEELKKALLEDPQFRDEILKELEYRTGRRDLLKAGALGLLVDYFSCISQELQLHAFLPCV